ncbi:hypothetical protein MCUN1_003892 [Malassezia cuniculi]|uniref:Chalcone isomerase domain-containing protein n=1 Tax=Malassezia cuniculi TaxID=948313 RepID=A0AAF0EUC9_9BASI|nr:hypothetical protein MCUN1_003892 [Malassezia cuniculi]
MLGFGVAAAAAAAVAVTATAFRSPVYLDAPHVAPPPPSAIAEPATKLELPTTITHRGSELCLVGLGVRRVTFIGINVYVAGLYVERSAAETAARAHAACAPNAESIDLEHQVREWLATGATVGVRIVPVRATEFTHLRDGLVRAANTRGKAIADDSDASREYGAGVRALKSIFPHTKVSRGSTLDLLAKSDGNGYRLDVVFDGKPLGSVMGSGVAAVPVELMLAYVGERPDISAALRANVRKHLFGGLAA